MPPSKPAYDVDWIWSNNSNVHVANHRDWFTSFTPLETYIEPAYFADDAAKVKVLGIGEITLPTKTHPTRSGATSQGTLLLRDVLYAPSSICNILGSPLEDEYDLIFNSSNRKITEHGTGRCVGLIDRVKLYRLRLRGQTPAQTSLDGLKTYVITVHWPNEERASWEGFRRQNNSSSTLDGPSHTNDASRPLTSVEKKWLKDNYGGEFKFLRDYGLSIYKSEDRGEGRTILRAMMRDNDSDHDSGPDSNDGSENSFLRELEEDPMSHVADYHFSEDELDWIKKHYRHSGNFLLCHGLKPFEDGDCQEGKAFVRACMGTT